MRRILLDIAYIGVVLLAVFVRRWTVRPPTVAAERSLYPGWIEVCRHGELSSEWHETKDPELWKCLDCSERAASFAS
jgi:hypothetical protein